MSEFKVRTFLFSATRIDGTRVTDRVEASSLQAAQEKLAMYAYRDIEFHTDSTSAATAELFGRPGEKPPSHKLSPKLELRINRGINPWFLFALSLLSLTPAWLVLLVIAAKLTYHGTWLTAWSLLFFLPLAAALYFLFRVSLPSLLYNAMIQNVADVEYEKVLRDVARVRRLRWLIGTPIPAVELAFREAGALAYKGRLPDALAKVEPFGHGTPLPAWRYQARHSSVYLIASLPEEAIARDRRILQLGSEGESSTYIQLCGSLLEHKHDIVQGRTLLEKIITPPVPDLAKPYVAMCHGSLAMQEGRHDDALAWLYHA